MTVYGFTPHEGQQGVIDSVLSSSAKFFVLSVGRQWGKSMLGMNMMLYWAFNDNPSKMLWVSPVYSQTTKVQKELESALKDSNLIDSINYSDNYLKLKNGSEIYFRSAERYDNIRGYTFDYAVLDEAAFMKAEAWREAIRPTLAVNGKKVLFLSTPKGKNWFYELFNLSKVNQNYGSFTAPSITSPYITADEIDDARLTLPPNIYKQEYLAEFLDDGGEVFTNLDQCTFDAYPKTGSKFFAGIDLGRQEDFTVCTIVNDKDEVVDIYRANQKPWNVIVDELVTFVNKYKAIAAVEVNSIGDVIYEQLNSRIRTIDAFTTTSKTKVDIIEQLVYAINNSEIKIPSEKLFKPLYNELSVFTYEYSPKTRNVKYGAPSGFHDDCVMSLAIAYDLKRKKSKYGSYSWMA